MITVCACDSHPIVIEGLRKAFDAHGGFQFLGAASSPAAALDLVRAQTPRVCLVDNTFGAKPVLSFIAGVRQWSAETEVVLWAEEMAEVQSLRALRAGARGIIRKTLPVEMILGALGSVARGNIWIDNSVRDAFLGFTKHRVTRVLTAREMEILALVIQGMGNRKIAEVLGISLGTVKAHLMHIFDKTLVKTRLELAMYGRKIQGSLANWGADGPRLAWDAGGPPGIDSVPPAGHEPASGARAVPAAKSQTGAWSV